MDLGCVPGPGCRVLSALHVSSCTHPHLCTWPKDAHSGSIREHHSFWKTRRRGHGNKNWSLYKDTAVACRSALKMSYSHPWPFIVSKPLNVFLSIYFFHVWKYLPSQINQHKLWIDSFAKGYQLKIAWPIFKHLNIAASLAVYHLSWNLFQVVTIAHLLHQLIPL